MEPKKTVIGIDIDGVIRNLYEKFSEVLKREHPEFKNIDLINTDEYFFDLSLFDGFDIYKFWFEEKVIEIYLEAKPFGNPGKAIKKMREYFTVYLVSHQPNEWCERATLMWLSRHSVLTDGILFMSNKWDAPIDILIDDKGDTIEKAMKCGIITFMINYNYNKKFNSHFRVNNYNQAFQLIKNKFLTNKLTIVSKGEVI